MPVDDDEGPRPADQLSLIEDVAQLVRAHSSAFKEAGQELDREFSLVGVRRARLEELLEIRRGRSRRLQACLKLRTIDPGQERRTARRGLPGAPRPGEYRRKIKGLDAFLWKRQDRGDRPGTRSRVPVRSWPMARMNKAIGDTLEYVDRDMTLAQAKLVALLSWLCSDRSAHEASFMLCEFQRLPWEPWSQVGGEAYQGRALCARSLDGLLEWAPDAMAILRTAMPRAKESERKKGPGSERSDKVNQAVALLLKANQKGEFPSIRQVAAQVGLSHTTLGRNKQFRAVWDGLSGAQATGRVHRGERDKETGEIVARFESDPG